MRTEEGVEEAPSSQDGRFFPVRPNFKGVWLKLLHRLELGRLAPLENPGLKAPPEMESSLSRLDFGN